MDLVQGEGAGELLQAQVHVWKHIFSYISSMSLKCAVELGIPDIIHNHGQPMTLSKLVDALPIAPGKTDHVHRLMRLLVHSGFFALEKNGDQEEGYVLTPSSKLLLSECKTSLTPFLLMMLDPVVLTSWHSFSKWFQGNDRTAFVTCHGLTLWEHMGKSPETNDTFNRAMASDSKFSMNILVKEFGVVFQGLRSLVDVGGGIGGSAMTIATAFPDVKCSVLDLPHVVATAPKDTNITYVGGDMFKAIPKADAVFIKWILHDWSDDECVQILRRCKEAIPSKEEGGKVIIVDMVVNTKHGNEDLTYAQLYFDMNVMVDVGGKERDECEWKKIFIEAGFAHYKITPALGVRSVIEVYP